MIDNKIVLQSANEAISAGDIEGFLSFCDDDILWMIMGGDSIQGKESVRLWMKTEYVEPPKFTVTDLIAEGDLVVALGQIETRDSEGAINLSFYSDVWRFRNGKMIELRAFVVGASPSIDATQQLALSASEAVAAIASGRLSAEAYVTTLLDRAEQQASLGSIIALDREGALAQARRVDTARAAGQALGPLAGLPIIIKDNINTAGLPTTGGTPALQHFRPAANAPVVQSLVDAGAIILGKSNLHELAFGITTTNFSSFAGVARNPYDPARIAGGSSGGTGAAIAARIVPAGLGTDTGGSVRVPSAFNGIAGLRPSVGNGAEQRRYSGDGVLPIAHTLDTVGPMGRTVADVALLDAVVSGGPVPTPAALTGLRLGIPAAFWAGLEDEVAAAMQTAKDKLSAAGVAFVEVDIPDVLELGAQVVFPVALHEPIQDIPAYLHTYGATGISLQSIAAQIASPDVKATFDGPILNDAFADAYTVAIQVHRPQLQKLYADCFQAHKLDALFFPTTPVASVAIDFEQGSSTLSINGGPPVDTFGTVTRNAAAASAAGLPGLALPVGMTPGGMPVGAELDGLVGSDQKLLSIGMAIEAVLGSVPAPQC